MINAMAQHQMMNDDVIQTRYLLPRWTHMMMIMMWITPTVYDENRYKSVDDFKVYKSLKASSLWSSSQRYLYRHHHARSDDNNQYSISNNDHYFEC